MTMTHQSTYDTRQFDVRAWQFSLTEPIPVWVARKFHRLSSAPEWSSVAMENTVVRAGIGDWVVCLDENIAVVLSNDEFIRCFRKL